MAIKLSIKKRNAHAKTAELKSLDDAFITIGSDPSATVYLPDTSIAPEQAVIINEDNEFLLISRADGTKLNFENLQREGRRVLSHGDELVIGDFLLNLSLNGEIPSSEAKTQVAESALVTTNGHSLAKKVKEKNVNNPHKDFAEILDTLRTEEDKYYFQIEIEGRPGGRLPIDDTNMILGWDLTQKYLSLVPNIVVTPRATVRKDWSGVIVHPQEEKMIWVNGEEIKEPTRLQNGDRLSLTNSDGFLSEMSVVFYEPTSMLVLDSLLPQQLPPPVVPVKIEDDIIEEAFVDNKKNQSVVKSPTNNRTIFGYFSLMEVAVLVLGTLVTAFIIFLVLELSS